MFYQIEAILALIHKGIEKVDKELLQILRWFHKAYVIQMSMSQPQSREKYRKNKNQKIFHNEIKEMLTAIATRK